VSKRPFTIAMVAGMPFPMAKASVIRVNHIVNALVNRYDDIRVKVFAYEGSDPGPAHPRIDLHLVGGFDRDKTRYYAWSNKLGADYKLLRSLMRHRREFALIHCHTLEGLVIAKAFKLLTHSKVPVCIDVHGPIVEEMVHYELIPSWGPVVATVGGFEKLMLRSVQQVFVSNEGLRDTMAERAGADKIKVVFDYVALELFAPDRIDAAKVEAIRRQHKPVGTRFITYLGMFKDYQGVDFLLRVFALLAPRYPDVRLVLVGDGPCRAQYDGLIREHQLGNRVVMPGLIPHADVPNWLAVSDIVVSPRVDNHITRSGFVSQMPEYMAAGKLIVSTWVSGCRYLLRDDAGILVEPNDVNALHAGIEQALSLPAAERERLAANARRNVAQFTWQRGIADVYDSYRRLLDDGEDVLDAKEA
jgi:glycosyltransferase involved in cell wall biosynthesis